MHLDRTKPADFAELTKPRIVLLVMLTVAAGFWMGSPGTGQAMVLFHLLFGTALVASGTNALNQVAERDLDAMMNRTKDRPLPAGRLTVKAASVFAWLAGIAGALYLAAFVNAVVAALATATLISYVFIYTPLKRRTTVSILIGAVPGALPIAGGWAAATGTVGLEAWVLFWILFLWQLPHFLALGWLYREDYARANLKMVSTADANGGTTFLYASLYAAALLPVSLVPALLGMVGSVYFVGAALLSAWFLFASGRAATRCSAINARRLFRLSLAYLPLLLVLMAVNRSI